MMSENLETTDDKQPMFYPLKIDLEDYVQGFYKLNKQPDRDWTPTLAHYKLHIDEKLEHLDQAMIDSYKDKIEVVFEENHGLLSGPFISAQVGDDPKYMKAYLKYALIELWNSGRVTQWKTSPESNQVKWKLEEDENNVN